MSAFLRAFVQCDGCGDFLRDETVPQDETLREALRAAKRYGWKRLRVDGLLLVLCPGCAHVRRGGSS